MKFICSKKNLLIIAVTMIVMLLVWSDRASAGSVDCRLRIFDGVENVEIQCYTPENSYPLRIAKGGVVYGLTLVDPDDGCATRVRIKTVNDGIMALEKSGCSGGGGFVSCGDSFDYEGETYDTVQIGAQCWIKNNMATTKYPDGSNITKGPAAHGEGGWSTDQSYYSCPPNITNDGEDCPAATVDNLGYLYQWSAAMNGSVIERAQGICPTDWHIPTDGEIKILEGTVDATYGVGDAEWDNTGWRGDDAGMQLKQGGSSGFNALIAGFRGGSSFYNDRGSWTELWSSSESGGLVPMRDLGSGNAMVSRGINNKNDGFSVRCIKDTDPMACKSNITDTNFQGCIAGALAKNWADVTDVDMLGLNDLNCWNSSISNINGIRCLSNLTNLEIERNQLTSIPAEIGNLTNLTDNLNLMFNQITSVPAEIGNLTNLKWLYLDDNLLTSLPAEIGNLSSLQNLYVNNNLLTSLPAEIGNLSAALDVLMVVGNNISTLPSSIGNLTNLRYLFVGANPLASLPAEIGNLTNLVELNFLNAPNISSLPVAQSGMSLNYLNLIGTSMNCLHPNVPSWNATTCND